jgi:hypothetical protein
MKKAKNSKDQEKNLTVKLYEQESHTRTEYEDGEYTLEICTGFLGVIFKAASMDQLGDSKKLLEEYLEANKEVLNKMGVREFTIQVFGGLYHDVCSIWSKTPKRGRDGLRKSRNYDEDEGLIGSSRYYFPRIPMNGSESSELSTDSSYD